MRLALLDPGVQDALERYFAARQAFEQAVAIDEVDAAVYELKAAEMRFKLALERLKAKKEAAGA